MRENIVRYLSNKGLIHIIHHQLKKLSDNNKPKRSAQIAFKRKNLKALPPKNMKMFNIASHYGNTNQNQNEIISHSCHSGYYPKKQSDKGRRCR